MDMTKTSQITERDLVSIFMSSYRDPYRAVRRSMKRSCLIGLDFQEFLAAVVKIAEVVHDGTYKSRDTSWEEEDEENEDKEEDENEEDEDEQDQDEEDEDEEDGEAYEAGWLAGWLTDLGGPERTKTGLGWIGPKSDGFVITL